MGLSLNTSERLWTMIKIVATPTLYYLEQFKWSKSTHRNIEWSVFSAAFNNRVKKKYIFSKQLNKDLLYKKSMRRNADYGSRLLISATSFKRKHEQAKDEQRPLSSAKAKVSSVESGT